MKKLSLLSGILLLLSFQAMGQSEDSPNTPKLESSHAKVQPQVTPTAGKAELKEGEKAIPTTRKPKSIHDQAPVLQSSEGNLRKAGTKVDVKEK